MKQVKRILALLVVICIVFGGITVTKGTVQAATSLPNEIYLKQNRSGTCTLSSAAMMLRSKAYLSGNDYWSSITESGIESRAWASGVGLYWSWSYSIGDCSFKIDHTSVSGMHPNTLKALLNSYPEGIVLYCRNVPHAVFLTDYEGDTFYCADPASYYSGSRIPLASSYLGRQLGSQSNILNSMSAFWYISSSNVPSHKPEPTPTPEPTGLPFTDIYASDWYLDAVKYVYSNGIMTGMSDHIFGPVDSVSRGQFAVMLYRLEGLPATTYTPKFADVPAGMWYSDAIMWANEKGIINGYMDGNFGTDDAITREQMATMMYRYASYKGYNVSSVTPIEKYIDFSHISPFAMEALEWAVGSGIITGKDNSTRLAPLETTARAECAVVFMRFMEKYK